MVLRLLWLRESGASVAGLIFLDPALVHESVIKHLKQIQVPAILLGADEDVFKSRKRQQFFKQTNGSILEVSFQRRDSQ